MSGNKCQYHGCGKTSRKFPAVHFFRFPKDERHKIWITNSGSTHLFSLDQQKLHNRYICQEHFPPESFMNAKDKKKLVCSAIPYKHMSKEQLSTLGINDEPEMELVVTTPIITYSRSKSGGVELIFPSPSSNVFTDQKNKTDIKKPLSSNSIEKSHSIETDSPKNVELKKKLTRQNKIIYNKTSHITKLKNRLWHFKMRNRLKKLLHAYEFPSISSKSMVTMQLKNGCQSWTKNEKNLALRLFNKSPSVYKFLRSQKINLPGLPTIRRWINKTESLIKIKSSTPNPFQE